ncbi:hypothetical protein [uncultured Erythrobacter sp.]|uniref:hypothetical protein n=1 Tax=uncultured Erythrobacter sp. TaxID=263913 RepID=UPI002605049F|nr:hypothetical protein [uncultured Erythrobacter sp.]
MSLYQFNGQEVRIEACGEQIIAGSFKTSDATGHSKSEVFRKRDGCKLSVKIGSDFDQIYDLSERTNYVHITYTGNPVYVDGLEECGPSCIGFVVKQFEEFPPLD